MSLGMYLGILSIASVAVLLYRRRMLGNVASGTTNTILTAASITTIEAAFLRAGRQGVEQVRAAAVQCGAQPDDVDVTALEAGLARRGFTFAADAKRTFRRIRIAGCILAVPAALATAIHDGWLRDEPGAAPAEFAILWGGAAIAVLAVTHMGSSTELGRKALAMRQAAYPLRLLRDADPTATVAHYGGTVKRRAKGAQVGDNDGDYVWLGDAGSSPHGHDGSGGHSSSSCAGSSSCASSCGSGGCGGH